MISQTQSSRRKLAVVNRSRWAAYVGASAASVLGCAANVEADIIYSGPINRYFSGDTVVGFALEGAGNQLFASHHNSGEGISAGVVFYVRSATPPYRGAAIAGFGVPGGFHYNYASKLALGQSVNTRGFVSDYGFLASDGTGLPNLQWQQAGIGFLGFRFTGPGGVRYGWARIDLDGTPEHNFTLIDYAFADPGERITAGQTTSATVPESGGSLGLLALGCAGLLAWRTRRKQAEAS